MSLGVAQSLLTTGSPCITTPQSLVLNSRFPEPGLSVIFFEIASEDTASLPSSRLLSGSIGVNGNLDDSPPDSAEVVSASDTRPAVEAACLLWQAEIQSFLLKILRRQDLSDDAWQRTVVRALQSAGSVRLPTLRGWLFQIALNEARGILREIRNSLARIPPTNHQLLPDQSSHSPAPLPDSSAILTETRAVVQNCLNSLPPEQQEVIRQRIYLGRTFSEIATNLQLPLGTVLTWCRRGILKLSEDPRLRDLMKD